MVYNVKVLPTAEAELEQIVAHLIGFGENVALEFLSQYENQLELLRDGHIQYAFSRMDKLAALGYRTALVNNYLFLYYVEDNDLIIAHFFHQSQDYTNLLISKVSD